MCGWQKATRGAECHKREQRDFTALPYLKKKKGVGTEPVVTMAKRTKKCTTPLSFPKGAINNNNNN